MKNKIETMIQWSLLLWLGIFFLAGCSGGREAVILGLETERISETGLSGESFPGEEALAGNAGEEAAKQETIAVYVCGAVNAPGVYELPAGARMMDAVEQAGGFAGTADEEWLNLARRLLDGEQVRVCTREETALLKEQGAYGEEDLQQGEGESLVNLNTADRQELMTLAGIGEAKADAILAYRQEHGGFQSIEEIMEIRGIKEAVFLQIKDRITV